MERASKIYLCREKMHSQSNQHGNKTQKLPTTIVATKFCFDSKQTARRQLWMRTSGWSLYIVCIKWSIKISTVCDQSRFHGYRRSIFTPWTGDRNQLNQKRQCKQCNSNKINDYTQFCSREPARTHKHTYTHIQTANQRSVSLCHWRCRCRCRCLYDKCIYIC